MPCLILRSLLIPDDAARRLDMNELLGAFHITLLILVPEILIAAPGIRKA